jgi:hypothetical protein
MVQGGALNRHCERSEAIQTTARPGAPLELERSGDWIASLRSQ